MKNIPSLGDRLAQLSAIGNLIDQWLTPGNRTFQEVVALACSANPWFNEEGIRHAFAAIRPWLHSKPLETWAATYDLPENPPLTRRVGVVMAGNLPLVNFHDALAVLVSGHQLKARLSHQDAFLLPRLFAEAQIPETWASFTPDRLRDFDAVIATGSGNTGRYFEHYFAKYPSIIRKNRNSVAILDGTEDQKDYQNLSHDLFRYFGLGCRNVSLVWLPKDADLLPMMEGVQGYRWLSNHSRFRNNYDYQRAVYLVNKIPFYEGGFFLIRESNSLMSPISCLHVARYQQRAEVEDWISANQENIQCRVGKSEPISFGQTQHPGLWDYPDGIDTMEFLKSLRKALVF